MEVAASVVVSGADVSGQIFITHWHLVVVSVGGCGRVHRNHSHFSTFLAWLTANLLFHPEEPAGDGKDDADKENTENRHESTDNDQP